MPAAVLLVAAKTGAAKSIRRAMPRMRTSIFQRSFPIPPIYCLAKMENAKEFIASRFVFMSARSIG